MSNQLILESLNMARNLRMLAVGTSIHASLRPTVPQGQNRHFDHPIYSRNAKLYRYGRQRALLQLYELPNFADGRVEWGKRSEYKSGSKVFGMATIEIRPT